MQSSTQPSAKTSATTHPEMVIDLAVAIVGGGISGLYTATLLEKQAPEKTYRVFEATPRTGGRVLSLPTAAPNKPARHDLGPTWIWDHHRRMHALLRSKSIQCYAQHDVGEKLLQYDGRSERVPGDGSDASRVQGGMACVTEALARPLEANIRTERALRRIERRDRGWRLTFSKDEIVMADKVVLAIPPRVSLQVDGMVDVLPGQLVRQLGKVQTWMAGQMKVVFEYEKPFWREMGLSGSALCAEGPIGELFDTSVGDVGALMTFVRVAEARALGAGLEEVAVRQLVELFGEEARKVVRVLKHDWAEEEFVATKKDVNVRVRHPYFKMQEWRESMEDLGIMFASTEVAEREAGYLEGALMAAEAAADFAARDARCVPVRREEGSLIAGALSEKSRFAKRL